MGIIHGAKAQPRAIFQGLDSALVERLAPLVGSYVSVPLDPSPYIDQREYDLLVTSGEVAHAGHLHVLALGSDAIDRVLRDGKQVTTLQVDDVTASQLAVPTGVDGAVQALIARTLVPVLATRQPRSRWRWRAEQFSFGHLTTHDDGPTALLTSHAEDEVLAFMARRRNYEGTDGLVVALPVMPTEVVPWLRWFVDQARTITPESFPERMDWHEDSRWAPPALRTALAERSELEAAREEYLAEIERRGEELSAKIAAARSDAEKGPWRLLMEQGDEFERAAADALEALGFEVDRRDHSTAPGQPKLEDLRITDPSESSWVALAECKGHARGAQARAIGQLTGRPVHAYVRETGRSPDALYYIVNHTIGMAPPARPEPLESDPGAISILAEQGGAVIDSRALLAAQVTALADPEEKPRLRAALRASRGRWDGTADATVVGLEDHSE